MKVLTHAQALQVAEAMAALNKLPALLHARILLEDAHQLHIKEYLTGEISVWRAKDGVQWPFAAPTERYRDQAEFCACYQVPVPLLRSARRTDFNPWPV